MRDILREAMRILDIRLAPPLASDAPDGLPVTDVVCLMVPAPATQQHLDMQAQVAALFSEEGIRAAPSAGPPSRCC
jgi:PTS system nitrogen regulatory IIA component